MANLLNLANRVRQIFSQAQSFVAKNPTIPDYLYNQVRPKLVTPAPNIQRPTLGQDIRTGIQTGLQNWAAQRPGMASGILGATTPLHQPIGQTVSSVLTKTIPSQIKLMASWPRQTGEGVGQAASAYFSTNRMASEINTNVSEAAKYTRLGAQLREQGRIAEAKQMFAKAMDISQRSSNMATKKEAALKKEEPEVVGKILTNAIKTGMLYHGRGYAMRNPLNMIAAGTLSGALGGATGKDFYEEAGKGMAEAARVSALTQYTNPLISGLIGKSKTLSAVANNPILKQLVSRTLGGLGNMGEDEILARLEMKQPGNYDRAMSFIVGAALFSSGDPKEWNELKSSAKQAVVDVGNQLGLDTRTVQDSVVGQTGNMMPKFIYDLQQKIKGFKVGGMELEDIVRNQEGKIRLGGQLPQPQTGGGGGVPKIKIKAEPKVRIKGITTGKEIFQSGMQLGTGQQIPKVSPDLSGATKPLSEPQTSQIKYKSGIPSQQSSDDIIAQGRKQIGSTSIDNKKSLKQVFTDAYTQWVDRYNPLIKASGKAKNVLKLKGAELRPEYDPEYLVRRLTGAGGIANYRFQTELNPLIKQVDQNKIPKIDMDAYMANKRMAGFGSVGRKIYAVDVEKSKQIISALEAKYPQITEIAEQFYSYQDKGFQEMVDAGFISPEVANTIRQQNPDYAPLYRVMDEVSDYLGLPTRKTMQGSQPILKIKGSERKIESPLESIIGNTFKQRAAIEKNRVAKAIIGLQQIAPELGFKKVSTSGTDTITIWNNGTKEYWQVGQEIADVAKGVNEESMNLVLKILQMPASILRQGATGRNPEFMLPNVTRDQLDAGITSKYGYIPFVDYVSGLKSMLSNDDVYQKWQQSGAKIDLGELSGKKSIKAQFDEKTAKKGLFSWIGKGLDFLGKYSEQPTRVGLFKKAYQKTGNELLAMMESRDATVDFARMGSKMKVANSIIPFLNVGVQGFDKLIRAVKNNPGKVLVTAGIYGALPQIASQIYNLQNFPEEYGEIPQYEKDSNFILIKGRNEKGTVDYVTIPKGNIVPVIANPLQSFIEYLYKYDGQSFKNMALSVISETVPVLGQGQTAGEIAIKTIGSNIPQAIKPITENLLNKSFWKYNEKKQQTKEIVPSYLQSRPAYLQKYPWTPKMYEAIGAVLNYSPLKVQNLMEGYLAGYTKIPSQIVDMLYKVSNGEPIETNDKTILRRFIKETYPSSGSAPSSLPQTPGIIERLTGKVGATKKEQTMSPEMEKYAIEDMKYKMRNEGIKSAEVNGKVLYTKSNGDIGTIDPSFQPAPPKLTGLTELDKEAISRYKSDITTKINDIYELAKAGKIAPEEAEKQIQALQAAKTKAGGIKVKKPKKVTIKKVKAISVKPIKFTKLKMKAIKIPKAPKIKITKPKKTNIKIKR